MRLDGFQQQSSKVCNDDGRAREESVGCVGKKSPESLDVKEEGGNWVRTTGWWAETQGTGRRSAPDHIP